MTTNRFHQFFLFLLLGHILLCTFGCQWLDGFCRSPKPTALPKVLIPTSTLNDIVTVVNGNSSKIKGFVTNSAQVNIADITPIPINNCNVAYVSPQNFRVWGKATAFSNGNDFDIGSNSDIFWFWAKADPANSVYYCRHDQYAAGIAGNMIPIDPKWLIEAMGVTLFLPNEEPKLLPPTQQGDWVIETHRQTPRGQFVKRTTVAKETGCILSQVLYDQNGQIIAISTTPTHLLDPASGVIYPEYVNLDFWTNGQKTSMIFKPGNIQFNPNYPTLPDTFTPPTDSGKKLIDIGSKIYQTPVVYQQTPGSVLTQQ